MVPPYLNLKETGLPDPGIEGVEPTRPAGSHQLSSGRSYDAFAGPLCRRYADGFDRILGA